jgi:Holliday junction DNA helicase RuvA
MIEGVEGQIIKKSQNKITIKTISGITFGIFSTIRNIRKLDISKSYFIYTYLKVKEDGMSLYGFLSEQEKEAFKVLIGINSVGPKTALSILDTFTFEKLLTIVQNEDIEALSHVSGIGKKSAGRIILELSGKFVSIQGETPVLVSGEYEDAETGLLSMGFEKSYIDKKLSEIEKKFPDLSAKDIIKKVLKND